MPLDALAAAHGGLDEFRLRSTAEMAAVLKRLADGSVPVSLNAPDGSSMSTTVWTIDAARGLVSFSADANDPRLQTLIEQDEAVAVAYLDAVKLQFDLQDLVLVHGGRHCALSAAFPREMFRFQRRGSYRVRPPRSLQPVARLRHPMLPDMLLSLRVLDLSIGGCALFLPDDVPPIGAGVRMNGVRLELDADTVVLTSLRLQHITSINPGSTGVHLGCEMVDTPADHLRALQRYIDQTQKKRRMMALD